MGRPGPAGLSSAERADMWCRWKAGYRMREIARALRCDHGSIRNLLAQRGGIGPSIRHRAKRALTLTEREDISRGIAANESARSIAALYSDILSLEFHQRAVEEMCRVASEARIFPLLNYNAKLSPFVEPLLKVLADAGYNTSVQVVPYEFQRGGNQMLRVRKAVSA